MPDLTNFAKALALRISDEWSGKQDFPEDAALLKEILERLFINNPDECKKLIGTGLIEENYFDKL